MMSLIFGLFTQVSGSGPIGPFVFLLCMILGEWVTFGPKNTTLCHLCFAFFSKDSQTGLYI